ncbi:MAG: hypothetical protein QOJ54_2681 [Aliidongia sp.]|jgi:fatty-acid desaturase|nr:hypothetical protein [Aliidongia sp.]
MTASATEALRQAAGRAGLATARLEQRIACVTIATPAVGTIVALVLAVHGTVQPGRLELAVALILILLTELGLTVGFHRLVVHRSFTAPRPVRGLAWREVDPSWLAIRLLAWLGIAGEVRLPQPAQMVLGCRGRAGETRPSQSDGDTPS